VERNSKRDGAATPSGVVSALAAALLLAIVCVCGELGWAASPAAPEEAPWSLSAVGLKGVALFKNFSHFYETPRDQRHFRDEGSIQVEWNRHPASWSQLKILVEARGDDAGFARDVILAIPETSERRSLLHLKEGTVRFQHEAVEITLGKQIFAWGTADAYNPTDNLNPYDYLDVIDHEKLGVYAATTRLTAGSTSLTAVIEPFFTPSRLPLPNSRWRVPLPEEFAAVDVSRQLPSWALQNMQYGARLKTTFKGWDMAVSYFQGFEPTPTVNLSTITFSSPDGLPHVRLEFPRQRVVGLDASTTYKRFEFHGEVATRYGREDRVEGIVGLNHTWDEFELTWLDQVTVVLEYARTVILSSPPQTGVVQFGGLGLAVFTPNAAFRNAIAGHIRCKFSDATQVEFSGTVDLTSSLNYYFQPKLLHKLTEALHLETGFDVFIGGRNTFWGHWDANDRFFAFLKYFF
jgi:hypothetical protein